MATYKVLQDIEAEDKLLGWLTVRQFIYAVMVVGMVFAAFRLALIHPVLVAPFLPPVLLFSVLASPFGGDQPSEIWLLAKVRYFLKPRRRIWDQSGMKDLVTITAPKKIERILTNNLSQTEVRSRLQSLADTIDSRGWAIKHIGPNPYGQPAYALNQSDSERLIDASSITQEVPNYDTQDVDDMLDEQNSATAQQFTQMIASSEQARRQQAVSQMRPATAAPLPATTAQPSPPAAATPTTQPPNSYWFMNPAVQSPQQPDQGYVTNDGVGVQQASPPVNSPSQPPVSQQPQPIAPEEAALLEKIHYDRSNPGASPEANMRRINPAQPGQPSNNPPPATADNGQKIADNRSQTAVEPPAAPNPAIRGLASNNDLNVETIARQAEKSKKQSLNDEVVISLR
ncbi:hypothetical protein BH23PAT1_BH23PAT1_0890 [soil metagenome]